MYVCINLKETKRERVEEDQRIDTKQLYMYIYALKETKREISVKFLVDNMEDKRVKLQISNKYT